MGLRVWGVAGALEDLLCSKTTFDAAKEAALPVASR